VFEIKVLLISTAALPVPPLRYGGIEWVVFLLCRELNKLGHEVAVACPIGSKLPEGVTHIPTVNYTDPLEQGHEMLSLFRYSGYLDNYEIIHDHTHSKLVYNIFRQNPNRFKYFCSTSHDPGCVEYPIDKPNHITVSKSHRRNHLKTAGIESKVVYNAIDPDIFEYSEERGNRYLFISRPTPDKGPIQAVKFCRELDVPLDMICGKVSGITREAVIASMLCTFGSKWKWLGEVSHKEKVEYYKHAKALIFPTQWNKEPFGLVVVEALYSGCPVVTYDRGPMRELIEHGKTGFLAKTDREFKEYMLRVDEINPKDCHESVIKKGFASPERMTKDYIKLYRQILKGERW